MAKKQGRGVTWVRWLTRLGGGDDPGDDVREVGEGFDGRPMISYHFQKGGPGGNPPDQPRTHEESDDANLLEILSRAVRSANGYGTAAERLAAVYRIADELIVAGLALRRHVHAITSELGGAR